MLYLSIKIIKKITRLLHFRLVAKTKIWIKNVKKSPAKSKQLIISQVSKEKLVVVFIEIKLDIEVISWAKSFLR